MNRVHVLILAGGKGVRMGGEHPKTLAPVRGAPILFRILDAVSPICAEPTVVVGYRGDEVIAATAGRCRYVRQDKQLGTGHAVQCAQESLRNDPMDALVVIPGDHPLIQTETLLSLLRAHEMGAAPITLGTVLVPTYEGDNSIFSRYGRVIRGADGIIRRVVEYKDATEDERAIREVNVSYYCFDPAWLWRHIDALENKNASQEYYLTDMVTLAFQEGSRVEGVRLASPAEGMGVNTPEELEIAERHLRD